MKKINLGQKDIIHFVGVGGIGMSGLAQIMKNMGFKVQGSDQSKNKNTLSCLRSGIKIFIGHSSSNVKKATILVKSTAIKNNNIEIKYAKKNRIPVYTRAEVLADAVSLKKNIIITGSHGKTTTTSLVAKILSDQKLDPTIINGGVINSFKSNAKLGKGEWAILEADESDGSFLKLPINYSIVTNIDKEHLDYYKNYKNLENSFIEFINKTPPTGKAVICLDNGNIRKILKKIKNKNIITYGERAVSDYQIKKIKYNFDSTTFNLNFKDKGKNRNIKNINVKLLGKHNVLNAAAAFIVCLNLGANLSLAKKSLKNFSGVQRRMTKVFSKNKNDFYDDYAHHPTEISSILEGVHNVNSERKIISVFEPHRYSRIISLKKEFSKCFLKSNLVIVCPLYAAGEKKIINFDLINFANLIAKNSKTQVIVVKNIIELSKYFKKNLISNEIIIGMGAGQISRWLTQLKSLLCH
jgi:UDP-N-acetylmuramate--alanine ligase|tara:strand:- start:924 stop:2324 length:1401 start_codon:yes stop_codon:yes gene_type:complete